VLVGRKGSRDLTFGCTISTMHREELLSIWWVCLVSIWIEGGFTLALVEGQGVGSEVLLEQVQLNFDFQYECISVVLCGTLDNNTFLKMCIFKMPYWLH